jgi:hypothetical protein
MTNKVLKALDAALFLSSATQGETVLTNELADIMKRLEKLSPDLMRLVEGGQFLDPDAYGRVQALFAEIEQPDISDMTAVYVVVDQRVESSRLHDLDKDIAGHYEIQVPSYLSDELKAECALDIFHAQVAIKVLDDFSIVVGTYLDAPQRDSHGVLERLGHLVGITERTSF